MSIPKPSPNDYITADKSAEWLNTPSPFDSLDDCWKMLIIFYVFHVPVSDMSARARPLESFGWGLKSKSNDYKTLKNRLIKYGEMSADSFDCEEGWAKLKDGIEANNLMDFPVDITKERVVFRKTKSGENDSLLSHIRNAFAHGRITFYSEKGKVYVAMEDIDDNKHVSARMIVSKQTLLRWKTIIEAGPLKNNEEIEALLNEEEQRWHA